VHLPLAIFRLSTPRGRSELVAPIARRTSSRAMP
jgi:hypothetical protein